MNIFHLCFEEFLFLTRNHPVIMGFFKFSFFASLGELFSFRILNKKWSIPKGFRYSVILWGIVGSLVAFSFDFYSAGVSSLLSSGKLPGGNNPLFFAFFTSFFNNLTFAPLMMSLHKICHSYFNLKLGKRNKKITLDDVLDSISWKIFFKKICLKKVPFFWFPVHTLTFLLPETYRVLFASFLSFILGVFLTLS